jgi:hypothetical protein
MESSLKIQSSIMGTADGLTADADWLINTAKSGTVLGTEGGIT